MSNEDRKSSMEHLVDFLFSLVIIGTLLAVIFAGISGAVLFRAAVFAPSPEPPAEASQPPAPRPAGFVYGAIVDVVSGFYAGQTGVIMEAEANTDESGKYRYRVRFPRFVMTPRDKALPEPQWLPADDLRLRPVADPSPTAGGAGDASARDAIGDAPSRRAEMQHP